MLMLVTYGLAESQRSDGHGLKGLTARICAQVPTTSAFINEWKDDLAGIIRSWHDLGPIVAVGHSFGGGALIEAIAKVPDVKIDHLILLDPVPIRPLWGLLNFRDFIIPDNVGMATCFWRKSLFTPWSLPIRKATCSFANIYLNIGHSDFGGHPKVQNYITMAVQQLAARAGQAAYEQQVQASANPDLPMES